MMIKVWNGDDMDKAELELDTVIVVGAYKYAKAVLKTGKRITVWRRVGRKGNWILSRGG